MSTSDIRINRVVEIFKILYDRNAVGGKVDGDNPLIQRLIRSSIDINEEIESQYYDRASKREPNSNKQ